ncbi:MAG: Hsp70 family protein [Cyanobacteria bacterium J083]|nr:MAG: Hsp70 family protein [Cyanobacteria bacterium J083]
MTFSPNPSAAYAIDFGTSNTVVARWNQGLEGAEIVNLPNISDKIANNPSLIPSLIYIKNAATEQISLGQMVRAQGLDIDSDPRLFRNFKRGIAAEIQGFLPELDGLNLTFEQVGEWFLRDLIHQLKVHYPRPESLVLTVPVDSFEAYRHWLTGVCQTLDISQIRLIDEPTAAALGYNSQAAELLLVVDFGGGTIDLSLVKVNLGSTPPPGFILKWGKKMHTAQKVKTAQVLAKAGKNLGGSDIDNWLLDYFVQQQGLEKSALTSRLVEKLKIKLSAQSIAEEVYFDDLNFNTYQLSLDRNQLVNILAKQEFFSQLDELISQVLQQARRNGITKADIEQVLLVGGTTQIPAVQDWLKQYFAPEKIKSHRPFSAIATGALQLVQGIEIKDFLYHSYGIRYWNRRSQRHDWHPIIKSGQPYPMEQPIELVLGASVENQASVELIIGELGQENKGTEVYFDGSRLITRNLTTKDTVVKPLNQTEGAKTIAQLNPLGNPGSDRLKLKFLVDRECFLRLTVEDLLTNETLLNNQIVVELS